MNKHNVIISTIAILLMTSAYTAQAKPSSVGLGASWTDAPYKGYGAVYYPLPHIVFDNDVFFINNFTAGAYLYNQDQQKISVGISYLPIQFRPQDSDDSQMKLLDKRKSTLMAEAKYSLSTKLGDFSASISGDILDESNSILIGASYSYPIYGERWAIIPRIGFTWANDKHNNYYYGISHSEAVYSGLAYHDAKSSFTPYFSLIGNYALTENVGTYVGMRVDQLTGDVKNSPMISNSLVPSIFAGVNYSF